jgi:tight adherence protein C
VVLTFALLLFVLTTALGVLIGVRFWIRPKAAVDRLMETTTPIAASKPESLRSSLRHLIDAAGRRLGSREQDRERVLQLLVCAGLRKPGALNLYYGFRVVSCAALCAAAAGVCLMRGVDGSTLIMSTLGGLLAGYMLPAEVLRLMTRRRRRAIEHGLPNTLDLLTVCVESGLGLDQGIMHVARELGRAHPEMSEELSMINFETRAGKSRPEALRKLAARTKVQDLKELASVLIQADRFGTSVAQTLRTYSTHLRVQARQRAEEKAAQLSVKLVFPIFFFILPSLFVITVGPVVVRIVRDLLPMMNSI